MRKLTEKFAWLQLIFGLVLVGLGVLTIILAANGKGDADFDKTICIVWGIVLFLIAVLIIVFDILAFTDKADFVGLLVSGLFIGLGVFVLAKQDIIREVIATLLPYLLISIGGVLLLKTIILAVKRVNFKAWILPFVLGVIFVAIGIVFIFVDDMLNVIYIGIGVLFIVLGAVEMIGFVSVMANRRAREKGNLPEKARGKKKKEKDNVYDEPAPEYVEVEAEPKQIEQEGEIKQIE